MVRLIKGKILTVTINGCNFISLFGKINYFFALSKQIQKKHTIQPGKRLTKEQWLVRYYPERTKKSIGAVYPDWMYLRRLALTECHCKGRYTIYRSRSTRTRAKPTITPIVSNDLAMVRSGDK
jgi:hypothetical protein